MIKNRYPNAIGTIQALANEYITIGILTYVVSHHVPTKYIVTKGAMR